MKQTFMDPLEFKVMISGWIIIIVFFVGRYLYKKYKLKKENEKIIKTGEKLFRVLNEVEKLKNQKKINVWIIQNKIIRS